MLVDGEQGGANNPLWREYAAFAGGQRTRACFLQSSIL
jgi:hypothetical protein